MARFLAELRATMSDLLQEQDRSSLIVPVGLFLVISAEHGGDATAQELVKRMFILDRESKSTINFYYLGWNIDQRWIDRADPEGLHFDLDGFSACRDILKRADVRDFGGNADLILVDVECVATKINLRFDAAIRVDLNSLIKSSDSQSLGGFLQALIKASEDLLSEHKGSYGERPTWEISERLGLAVSWQSFLDRILDKLGGFFGAKTLQHLAVRAIGPSIDTDRLNELVKEAERKEISRRIGV